MSDFFSDDTGMALNFRNHRWRFPGFILDPVLDLSLVLQNIRLIDKAVIPRRILAVGIEVPKRPADIHAVLDRLKRTSRHSVHIATVPMAEGLGKFANVERALATVNIDEFEWLLIVDDDIAFSDHMLDRFITLSEMADLSVAQPAHKRSSFATYSITLRKPWSFVRETHFVEIGPLTAFNRRVFSDMIPFPPSRWCYGIDLVWSETARKKKFKMGIVDAAAVRHLRPVGSGYNISNACAEGEALVRSLDIPYTRAKLLGFEKSLRLSFLEDLAKRRTSTLSQS